MSVAMVSGMHDNFVFVVQSLMRARGGKFQKMHAEFCVNILAPHLLCSGIGRKQITFQQFLKILMTSISRPSTLLGTL
jgi:hypothetical protein